MNLLEELRILDTGDPGKWSMRVSLVLACVLFVLVSVLGIQLWVRGQLMPQLRLAREGLHELEQELAAAQLTERRMQSLRTETDQAIEQVRRTGKWLPSGPEAMDLTASLAAGWAKSLVYAVQPWLPAGRFDRPLQHTGAEFEIFGSYGEILSFLGLALASEQLQEAVEVSIQLPSGEEPGKLRANARLLAYFADQAIAGQLPAPLKRQQRKLPPPPQVEVANTQSPFGPSGSVVEAIQAPDLEGADKVSQPGGLIRVGTRSYELVEDPAGNLRLAPSGP